MKEFKLKNECRFKELLRKNNTEKMDFKCDLIKVVRESEQTLTTSFEKLTKETGSKISRNNLENLALHTFSFAFGVNRFREITGQVQQLGVVPASKVILDRLAGNNQLPEDYAAGLLVKELQNLGQITGPVDMQEVLLRLLGHEQPVPRGKPYTHNTSPDFSRVLNGHYADRKRSKNRSSRRQKEKELKGNITAENGTDVPVNAKASEQQPRPKKPRNQDKNQPAGSNILGRMEVIECSSRSKSRSHNFADVRDLTVDYQIN